jgi:hypothetical protein
MSRDRPRPDGLWAGVRIVDANLLESVEPGERRIARFERVFCPTVIALAMAQDEEYSVGI